jgi:hypothetical protein
MFRNYLHRNWIHQFWSLYDITGIRHSPDSKIGRPNVDEGNCDLWKSLRLPNAIYKQLLYVPFCHTFDDIKVSDRIKSELQKLFESFSSACEPPDRVIQIGSKLVIILRTFSPFGCKINKNLPNHVHLLIKCLEELSTTCSAYGRIRQVIVLCQNPRDFIGDPLLDSVHGIHDDEYEDSCQDIAVPVTRGKHEILNGALYGEPTISQGGGYILGKIVSLIQQARDSRRMRKETESFHVSFASCAWTDGCDFQVADDEGVLLTHYCLLESNAQAPAKSTPDSMSRICIESDIIASIPSSFRLSVKHEYNPDRIMVVKKKGICFEHYIRIDETDPTKTVTIGSPLLKLHDLKARASISVDRGPYIADLGSNHAVIGICASGFGLITCELFSVPMSLTYEDMLSVPDEDYEYLQLIGTVQKRVDGRGRRRVQFTFKGLNQFSAYCVVVKSSTNGRKLAVFKTLPAQHALIHSIILASIPRSGLHPSKQSLKISQLLDASAYSSYTIHLFEYDNDSIAARSDVLGVSQDELRLERQARISMTRDATYHCDSSVDVVIRGNSAVLTPRDTSAESCLSELLQSFKRVTAFNHQIVTILIVCSNPILRYYHRSSDTSSWASDRCFAIHHKDLNATLLQSLFDWKCEKNGRDVIYFSVMDVNEASVAYIQPIKTPSNSTAIRNIMLPRTIVPAGAENLFKFFDCDERFRYRIVKADSAKSDFTLIRPKVEVYGERMLPGGETIIYCVDVTNDPDYEFGTEDGTKFHGVLVRTLVHDADYLKLSLGPIVGLVTQTSASILIESNLDIEKCICRLVCPSLKNEEGEFVELLLDVKANIPARYDFANLTPDLRYYIILPDFFGDVYKGSFRTQQPIYKYTQLAFVGDNVAPANFPTIQKFFNYVNDGQVANISHIESEFFFMDIHHRSNASGPERNGGNNDLVTWTWAARYLNDIRSQTSATFHLGSHAVITKMFGKIAAHILTIVKRILSCANIDEKEYPKDAFVVRFRELASKSIILHLFQKDVDSILKQAFRTLYAVPELSSFLAHGSQISLLHSTYHSLFDPSSASKVNLTEKLSIESVMYLCDMLRRNSQIYILGLREQSALKDQLYDDFDSHFYFWRQGDLAVVSLDLVYGRIPGQETSELARTALLKSEAPKAEVLEEVDESGQGNDNDDAEEDEMQPDEATDTANSIDVVESPNARQAKVSDRKAAPPETYSPGFFNRSQWLKLKSIFEDATVSQLVIVTQMPFIGLQAVSKESTVANRGLHSAFSVPLEWEPTVDDLNVFLQLLVKWLDPKRGFGVARTAVLLSSTSVPYSTAIMDIKTGQIIHQVCVPPMIASSTLDSIAIANIRSNAVLSGKVKSLQYFHRFFGLDSCLLDPTREGSPRTSAIYGINDATNYGPTMGFGLLRVWFDSWKANVFWSLCRYDRNCYPPGPAVLTVGPIIGLPSYMKSASGESTKIEVPILIELDRASDITIELVECFTGVSKVVNVSVVQARIPKVVLLGNLNAETRYNCYFRDGILNPSEHYFVIQTFTNMDESNVAILNTEIDPEQPYCSDFIFDLCRRTAVPFNGINAIVHTNVSITFEEILREVEGENAVKNFIAGLSTHSIEELQKVRIPMDINDEIHRLLDRIREEFRVFFSRPSYRALLRSAFNMFLPAYNACEVHFSRPSSYGGFTYFFDLLIERVRQEYFDQLFVPRENPFRAVPQFPNPKENSKIEYAYDKLVTQVVKEVVAADAESSLSPPGSAGASSQQTATTVDSFLQSFYKADEKKRRQAAGKERDPNVDDVTEKEILRMKRTTFPLPIETPRNMDAAEAVFTQWRSNLIEPTVTTQRIAWISLNKMLSIECMAPPRRDYLREDFECYVKGELDVGVRLIIMHGDSVIRLYESGGVLDVSEKGNGVCGRRLQTWLSKWSGGASSKKACLVCPSSRDGNTSVALVPRNLKASESGDSAEGLELHLIGSIFLSTQKDMRDLKRALLIKFKNETPKKQGSNSRASIKARADQKKALVDAQTRELEQKFSLYLPDGYVIIECKCGSGYQSVDTKLAEAKDDATSSSSSASAIECRVWVRRITSLFGGEEEERALVEKADGERPGMADLMQLPKWFLRFLPGKKHVFVQDEVLMMVRQEPTAKKFLELLEDNGALKDAAADVYRKSRLSELSRKEEKREVDMSVPGTVEVIFREVMDHIWETVVPGEVKSHMAYLCDDFVRSLCITYALQGKAIRSVFASASSFGAVVHRSFILALQLFMAHKLSKVARYKRIVDLPEFIPPGEDSEIEDDDDDFMSEDGKEEEKQDGSEEFDENGILIEKQKPIAAPPPQPESPPVALIPVEATPEATLKEDPFVTQKRMRTAVRRIWGEKCTLWPL